jgi:hypothetical protein
MCMGGSSPSPPPLPPPAAPIPKVMDPSVIKARADERQRAALAGGRDSTILNSGGGQGLDTTNSNDRKTLLGN